MAVNKVVYGGNTLIDITDTTATASDVFAGKKFYGANGSAITGTATGIPSGGAANEVLIKESNTDYDVGWGSFRDIVPSTGIDLTYLAASVQSSLDLADSAYQLPATGIPSTDIEEGVIPDSKEPVNGGTDLSLVTTGEKFIWTANALPAVTSADDGKIMRVSNGLWTCQMGMAILSYGHSTWAEFIEAYNTHTIVYCRASSNSNPASGSQTRMAFMAYVNNADNPTEVEFQYYRSVSSHSITQQGDQVYVYKLNKNNGWSVTVRESYTKINASTGLSSSYSNSALTISVTNPLPAVTATDNGKVLAVVNGAWAAVSLSDLS